MKSRNWRNRNSLTRRTIADLKLRRIEYEKRKAGWQYMLVNNAQGTGNYSDVVQEFQRRVAEADNYYYRHRLLL